MVLEIVTDPDSALRRRADDPGVLLPAGIVTLVAVVAVVAAYPSSELTSQLATGAIAESGEAVDEGTASAISAAAGTVGLVGAFLGVYVQWALYAVAFYALARVAFDGSGSLSDTFAGVGWGYVPALVGIAVRAAANFSVFAGETLPEGSAAAGEALAALQSDPILTAATVFGLLMLLWSGYIWTVAMQHFHGLSRRDAAIVVGVPVALGVVSRLSGLV
ncbi:Yip1 family protein [Halomarina ordinaria]|uniref:YIP1 family protein n=1 Tax=Halomarina ordinaria TaxID=3033939 RepID=A0ABD5U706_9EURY|nr:Yip1 family protein [Halomarina sp. PSRA2]